MLSALEASGMSVAELSRRSGVSYDAINKVKRREGASTSAENASAIAAALGFEWDHQEPDAPNPTALVPVYDIDVSAGHGSIVDAEEHISNLAFSKRYLLDMTSARGNQLAAIKVRGDSMTPTIQHEDMVVIDMTKDNLDYDGLFVIRIGEALQIKRIGRGSKRTSVMEIADNSLYPPVDTERTEIDVVGKVIWYGRKV